MVRPLSPLHLTSAEAFTTVRDFLREAGYTAEALCDLLNVKGLHEVLAGQGQCDQSKQETALPLVARLLLLGESARTEVVRRLLPERFVNALVEMELLKEGAPEPGLCHATAIVYPAAGLYLASDRFNNPDGSPFVAGEDVVYPAITKNTEIFLRLLPEKPCKRLLDLCTGTGVAALAAVASGTAGHAWAADISARSTGFAEFNRHLNGLEPVTTVTGDLYEPVAGLTFDRIVAHPPYVPSLAPKWVFRDAGEAGEQVTHGIVAGLPRHLEPGGRFYCLSLGMERENESLEDRLRSWLGEASAEFDVLLVEMETYSPEELASMPLLSGQRTVREYQALKKAFQEAGASQFFYGFLLLQRKASPRPEFTYRRTIGPRSRSREAEWLLDWLSDSFEPDFQPQLMEGCYRAASGSEMVVSHRFENGELNAHDFRLKTDYPFRMECSVQPWTAHVLARCSTSVTGRALYDYCREQRLILETVGAEEFTVLLRLLVAGGFLEFQPPRDSPRG